MDSNFKNQMEMVLREYVGHGSKDRQEDQKMNEDNAEVKSDEELILDIGSLIES